ncbi:MAG: MarR family transcriptional regulator [Pseudomonadota bacterium]
MAETHEGNDALAVAIFSEIFVADQLARSRVAKALPKGMELSHFSVLNLLARGGEKSPADLARAFNVTRGAMTNTIGKLEWAGYVHVRPDWDDARRKHVAISPAGIKARDAAYSAIEPIFEDAVNAIGRDKVRSALPVIRELRRLLTGEAKSSRS